MENASVTPRISARTKLLDAAFGVIRSKGYAATTVDDLCTRAGVTKGAFFHHFKSKDDLAVAAAEHWSEVTGAMFAAAPYHRAADPLARIFGYLDLRAALLEGDLADYTCLVGTMLQETYETVPVIGAASYAAIADHAVTLEADFAAALALYAPADAPSAASLAMQTQIVLQGAFVLAKGTGGPDVVHDAIGHLRRYLTLLFNRREERLS